MAAPVLHYFDLKSLGRGEVVRLFLHELGIDFVDERYAYDSTWPTKSQELGLSSTGKLPVLEIDGHRLSQHIPILRYLARRTNTFDGQSNYEKYLVDAVSDIYIDWRAAWVASLSSTSGDHKKGVPKFYECFDDFYTRVNTGPYLLGDKPTYVDFAVFQALDNDSATGNSPDRVPESLAKLQQAILARPNVKEYLRSRTTV